MNGKDMGVITFRVGAFRRRIGWVFALQFAAVAIFSALGTYGIVPLAVVMAVITATTVLAWWAVWGEWRAVGALAALVDHCGEDTLDPESLRPGRLSRRIDADVASLARGLQGFANRIAGYNQRERNFTRDASHELRSPLTVIKMSVDMLAEEHGLSDFGNRSVQRMRRATREMEALVEALLILARESDTEIETERFVVNDVLVHELASARDLLAGRQVELHLEEPARFALKGSRQVFSVLCWQLIRNACQQTEQGRVVVTVWPGMVAVSNHAAADDAGGAAPLHGVDRHGFELAIAQRISDRFQWSLELQTIPGQQNIARIRFPHPLPAGAPRLGARNS
jgi:signal transduction histidine kinase